MHTIYLALGSNVGDMEQNLDDAIRLLSTHVKNIKQAKRYKTKPWGFSDQDNFLNSALSGTTELAPHELLIFVKNVEQKIGRKKRFQNGPREIDIDILFYDDVTLSQLNLTIPHPSLHLRDFVLVPLFDIAPDFIHPVMHRSVKELLRAIIQENML